MSEKYDYQTLRLKMIQPRDRIERIENVVGVGTPDISCCIEGKDLWIELKSPKEPKHDKSKLFADNHKLSQSQMNWFLKQCNAGGSAYILIATDKRWILIDGIHADEVNNLTCGQLRFRALWCAKKPIKRGRWAALRDVLKA